MLTLPLSLSLPRDILSVKQQSPQPGRAEEAIGECTQGKCQRRSAESLHVARQNVDIRTSLLERPRHRRV